MITFNKTSDKYNMMELYVSDINYFLVRLHSTEEDIVLKANLLRLIEYSTNFNTMRKHYFNFKIFFFKIKTYIDHKKSQAIASLNLHLLECSTKRALIEVERGYK